MQKLNTITKINGYFYHSEVILKLCKEYLNVVTCNIPFLLQMNQWTVWYTKCFPTPTYTGVTMFKTVYSFLAHPICWTSA